MTIPVWVLLAFTLWTLVILGGTVGVHRWAGILTKTRRFEDFAEYRIEGKDWYKRSMRAHANCVENLPVYGSLVLILVTTGIRGEPFDTLALTIIGARVLHTSVHVGFRQTNGVVACRSMLFITQWACMLLMGVFIANGMSTSSGSWVGRTEVSTSGSRGTTGSKCMSTRRELCHSSGAR